MWKEEIATRRNNFEDACLEPCQTHPNSADCLISQNEVTYTLTAICGKQQDFPSVRQPYLAQ